MLVCWVRELKASLNNNYWHWHLILRLVVTNKSETENFNFFKWKAFSRIDWVTDSWQLAKLIKTQAVDEQLLSVPKCRKINVQVQCWFNIVVQTKIGTSGARQFMDFPDSKFVIILYPYSLFSYERGAPLLFTMFFTNVNSHWQPQ